MRRGLQGPGHDLMLKKAGFLTVVRIRIDFRPGQGAGAEWAADVVKLAGLPLSAGQFLQTSSLWASAFLHGKGGLEVEISIP